MAPEEQDSHAAPRGRGALLFCGLAIAVAGLAALLSWLAGGAVGLGGALLGLAVGGAIAGVGYLLRRRARSASGPRVVSAMMIATFASFGMFLVAAVGIGIFWREAAAPAILTALAIYLSASFYEVLSA